MGGIGFHYAAGLFFLRINCFVLKYGHWISRKHISLKAVKLGNPDDLFGGCQAFQHL